MHITLENLFSFTKVVQRTVVAATSIAITTQENGHHYADIVETIKVIKNPTIFAHFHYEQKKVGEESHWVFQESNKIKKMTAVSIEFSDRYRLPSETFLGFVLSIDFPIPHRMPLITYQAAVLIDHQQRRPYRPSFSNEQDSVKHRNKIFFFQKPLAESLKKWGYISKRLL